MADELAGQNQGTGTQTQPGSGPSPGGPSPSPSVPAQPSTPSTSQAGPSTTTAQSQAGQGQPGSFLGVREALKSSYGLDLTSQFQDDHAALAYLAQAARQAQQYSQMAPYAQLYAQHAEQFQAWLANQQKEQAAQQALQQKSWWQAPQFDPSWRSKLTRDPQTGQLRSVDGADPALPQKYLAWLEHQQNFLDKFSQDPISAIKPGIEEMVRSIAQEMIQQNFGGYQEQTFARSWVSENSAWLHARDQNNNVLRDPMTGRPQLSELGARFANYVRQAEEAGMTNVQAQRDFALKAVQADVLIRQFTGAQQTQTAAQAGDAQKQAWLQQAAGQPTHQPNLGGSTTNGVQAAGNTPPIKTQRDLQNLMLAAMQQNGFTPNQALPMGAVR